MYLGSSKTPNKEIWEELQGWGTGLKNDLIWFKKQKQKQTKSSVQIPIRDKTMWTERDREEPDGGTRVHLYAAQRRWEMQESRN